MTKAFAAGDRCLFPNRVVQVLEDYLDYLELEFSNHHSTINISQVQEMLLEISCIIRSGEKAVDAGVYARTLERLSRIYAQDHSRRKQDALSLTADDYAEVVEVISNAFPGYDYREVVGQLLRYMGSLFRQKKGSWITVYEHIRSMPESIEAVQALNEARFLEIQEWVEEGVHNLFSIHSDVRERIAQLEEQAGKMENRMEHERHQLTLGDASLEEVAAAGVACLEPVRRQRRYDALSDKRDRILQDRQNQVQMVQLIESNIREFETVLKEARRRYLVRLVHSH